MNTAYIIHPKCRSRQLCLSAPHDFSCTFSACLPAQAGSKAGRERSCKDQSLERIVKAREAGMEATAEPTTTAEILADIEALSQNPLSLQHQLLQSILEKHGQCHYLKKLGVDRKSDVESFKAAVPLSSYADYQVYLARIKDGDKSPLLCCSLPVAFAMSSGTTAGVSKCFPVAPEFLDGNIVKQRYVRASLDRSFPSKLPPGTRRILSLYLAGKSTDTKSGFKARTVTAVTVHSEKYRRWYESIGPASPIELLRCPDTHQGMYGILLSALSHASALEGIEGLFAFSLVELFRALKRLWPSLCYDIRHGQVNEEIVTDIEVRNALLSRVVTAPNADSADRIQRECESDDWDGIVLRLFPNLQYFVCASTGSMSPFATILDGFTRENFPKVGFGYGSSESGHSAIRLHGINPDDFVFWPRSCFCEFIPVTQSLDSDEQVSGIVQYEKQEHTAVELTEVRLGQEYELVVTTPGLYRYQTQDIFRVTGFYNSLPTFKFVCRKGVVLSINTDKTDEAELLMLIDKATQRSKLSIQDFIGQADHSSTPGHYIIYLEFGVHLESPEDQLLNGSQYHDQGLQECCDMMDSSLNEPYRRGRRHGFIGPLELRILRNGTFDKLREFATQGVGTLQYKSPRCVVNPRYVALLQEGTLKVFHSLWKGEELISGL